MRRIYYILTLCLLISLPTLAQKVYKDYQDGRIYVKLKSSFNPKTMEALVPNKNYNATNLPFAGKIDPKFGITYIGRAFSVNTTDALNSTLVVEFKNAALVDELLETLKYDRFVEYAEKIPVDLKHLVPNDPQFGAQWHLAKIQAAAAWNYVSAGSNVVIAIVDDAIQRSHPDLQPNIWVNPGEIANNGIDDDGNGFIDDINGWDVASNTSQVDPPGEDFDHGTHVAGIASAATNNGVGVASIGFSCKIMCVKATTSASSITAGYNGILYAANSGAKVINMSWGGSGTSLTNENVINYALSKGCILVASAGNDNSDALKYPAAYNGVISVASTTTTDQKSSFSNYGSWVKISAPGSAILSTVINSTYGNLSGTSMASPMVAGLIGLMKFLNPTMPNTDLIQCLYNSSDNISVENPSFSGQLGAGRINAQKALECVAGTLNRAPIADFVASPTTIVKGNTVTFTDQSSYSPASWQWSFPGGSPATFNGKNPPTVKYDNAGTYSVSLTVTNANGNNTVTKTNLITVIEPPTCLTVNLPVPSGWTIVNYTAGTNAVNGFVNGMNSDLDRQKAMFFNLSATNNTTLTSVAIGFGRANTFLDTKVIPIRVFNANGPGGGPGTQLAVFNLTMKDIMEDVQAGQLTLIDFPQSITLPASKQFFISVDISNLSWDFAFRDTLSIASNVAGQSATTPIWEQGSDLVWRRYGTPGAWNLTNAELLIHPFVTPNPALSVISPKNPVVCSGGTVNFSAAGSTYGDIIQWQLPGVNPPQIINNQMAVSPLYPASGSFKAYLLTRGGCGEVRVDSAQVTVNQSPVVNITAGRNPICAGQGTTLTASGATSYTWTPGTGLSATTGTSVTANPAQTTTYTVTGTTGSCSSQVPFELEVRGISANVTVSANPAGITAPTMVTFTATPSNGGSNPTYRFFVNDAVQQSGSSSIFSRTVSPGDKVKCEMTSNETCVVEKVVMSNEITMSSPLPITLVQFTGRRTANGHALSWMTGGERNSEKFVIERGASDNAFAPLAEVAAAGNSTANLYYNYLDAKPIQGSNYYRLRMVDRDGSFKYSNIVLLENRGVLNITAVQPNPTRTGGNAILTIAAENRGPLSLTISNAAGQVLREIKVTNTNGYTQVPLQAASMASGTYLITCRNAKGEVMETIKWSVVR